MFCLPQFRYITGTEYDRCIALDGKGGTNELAPHHSVRTMNKALCIR